jgi:steroid delta-isomerase-like uncharacterized protein
MRTKTAPGDLTVEQVGEFGARWMAAWNGRTADGLLALLTEDVVYRSDGWPKTMRGHADVLAFLRLVWAAFPDLRFQKLSGPYLTVDEPKAAFHWQASATHTGRLDPPGYAPTGKRFEFDGVDIHEYRDDKVAHVRSTFDSLSIAQQLGFVPRRRAVAAQRATVQAQRTATQVRQVLRRRAER